MNIQSQIIRIKALLKPKSGFLIIETFVVLFFCFVFILILLKFNGEVLSLYERFFVRSIALNLAANAIDGANENKITGEIIYCGRAFKLTTEIDKSYGSKDSKKVLNSNVIVTWANCRGCNEKLTLGST